MTASGRLRKRQLGCAGALLALGAAFATLSAPVLQAATTERVVVDRHTGLAIYGVDPVAYFTDRKPVVGRPELEHRHAGVIWRFDNEGNRAAFVADPDVYMPRYGGYDPVGIARGLSTPGYPELWVIHDERLFLFYTAAARATFLENPATIIASASARWAAVKSELSE
jgi:hypothetical protein